MKLRFLLSLTALAAAQPAAAQSNHSQLFFDASGSDQAAYAGNQIITISGNLTYYGRRDPQPSGPGASLDFVQPASDVYVVPNGWWKGGQADGLPLEDVSNAPNTILGFGGGGFFEEPIATTHPQGSLVSGDYDVVFDEHQDGAFQSHLDFYVGHRGAPAISVRVDANAPSLPGSGIAAMKLKATRQYEGAVPLQGAWVGIQNIMDPQARLLEAVTKLGEGTAQPGDFALNYAEILEGPVMLFYATFIYLRNQLLPQFKQADDFMAMPFSAATAAIENKMKRAVGLAADPPDPNFAAPVVLAPRRAPNATNMDPLARAMAAAGAATDEEQRLAAGLLAAVEKYQGAAAGHDPRWALHHARAAQRFATLLEAQTARSAPSLSALRTQLASYPVNLDAVANVLAGRQAVVRTSGWPAEVKLALAAVGATGAEMEKAAEDFAAMSFGFSRTRALADLDAAIAAASGSTGYADLATSLGTTITMLLAEPSLDKGDPLIAIAPAFTGTARTPLALTATGSDPLGREVTIAWDLDGDGAFDDAQGAAIAHTWPAAFNSHVGVQITNAAGRTAHAWAHVAISDTNRTPVFAGLTPRKAFVESETGIALTFHAEANDPDAQVVTIQWLLDNAPVGTGTDYTFTPSAAQAGVRALVAKATDGQGGETTHVWLLALKKPGVALADLSVTMEAPETPVQTGAEFTWTMTVENHGPSPAANVVLTHTLPAGLTFVRSSTSFGTSGGGGNQATANFGTVAAGGLVTMWVQTTAAAAGSFQSSATVSSAATDFENGNNTGSARVRVNAPSPQSANVSLAAAVAPSPATVGGTQTITFTTANAGPDSATGLILETQLPESVEFLSSTPAALSSDDGLVRIALPDVASGANTAASVVVRPSQAGSGPAHAQVFAAQGDPSLSNNQADVLLSAVFVPPPVSDLVVTQTPPASARAGLPATWVITVTNNGPDAAENVSLSDVLPAGAHFAGAIPAPASLGNGRAAFSLGTLAHGASRSVSITVEPPFAGEAVNRVTAASRSQDANGAESLSAVNVQAAPATSADLSATLSAAPATVLLNGQVTLTLTLANAGPDAATAVRAVTQLPDGLAFVSASAGATHSEGQVTATAPSLASGAQAVFTITAAAQAARAYAVISEVHSEDRDPAAANNRATAAVTVQNAPPQPVDLAVTQYARSSVTLGDSLNVTLTVTNRGPGAATNVTLTETLPAGFSFSAGTSEHGSVTHDTGVVTATLGTLAVNESATIELVLAAQAAGPALLAAVASGAETETAPADNSSSLTVSVLPVAPVKLKATYRFDDTLAACEPDAPPLVAIDPSNADAFAAADVNGRMRRVYRWNGAPDPASAQAGLKLNTAGLLPRDNYSVEMLFRFTEGDNAARSILHTANRAGDHSLYVSPQNHVVVSPLTDGPAPFTTGRFHHLTLTVSGGTVTTWLDGVLQRTETTTGLDISTEDLLHFFVDNEQGTAQNDYADGEIALLRVYEGALPPNRIAAQAAYPFGPDAPMDALAQFSINSNPAGAWAYGHSTTRGTPFLYDAVKGVGILSGLLDHWSGNGGGPHIIKNLKGSTASYYSIRQPPDLLNFDPSYDARNAVLRWTAPAGGTYRVQGRFQGIDVSNNGTDVAVLKNGDKETTLFEEYVSSFDQRKPFAVTVTLAMGETVDFSVGIGGNINTSDSTGVDAVVTPILLTDDCDDGTDLAVTHLPAAKVAAPGETIALEIAVTNAGLRPAPGVVLTDIVPAGLSFVSASAENGTVQQSGSVATISLGTLAPGETRPVTVILSGNAAGVFTNQVSVSSGSFDPALENNEASAAITVGSVVPLAATVRTTVDSVTAGSEVVFELVMANGGTFAAPGCVLSTALPAGTAFVSATGGGALQNGTVAFPARSLAVGETAGYALRLRANEPGLLTLTALASSTNPSVREASGSADITVRPAVVRPDLHVAISTAPAQLYAGCRVTCTYTVTNTSPTPAANVTLRGLIPSTLVVISAAASQGSATVTGGQLNAALGQVLQGTPATVTVEALATAAEATGLSATVSGVHPSSTLPPSLSTSLLHLWDFNEPAGPASHAVLTDRAGTAHGGIRGAGALSTGSGIQLPGGDQNSAAYVDLPNGLISPLRQVTLEGWVTINAFGGYFSHILSFGSSEPGGANGEVFGPGNANGGGWYGLDYISLTADYYSDYNAQRFAVRNSDPSGGGESYQDSAGPTTLGQRVHFVLTADSDTPGITTFRYYRDGVLKSQMENLAFSLTELNDVNNWLGRGNYTEYPCLAATYDEFRLYNRALTPAEIEASRLAGPDALTAAAVAGFSDPAITSPSTASTFIRRDITIPPPGSPCAVPVALRIFKAPAQQSYRLEWTATPGRKFLIQSSPDLQRWINVPALHTATQTTETWTDPGPPATEIAPSQEPERFYRVLELAD